MKKVLFTLFVALLVLSLGAAGALAASKTRGPRFVDADHDGVCDLCGCVDANGDGVCDARPADGAGRQNGRGRRGGNRQANRCPNFVDADGDGVCDHCQEGGRRPGNGGNGGAGRGRQGGRR